MLNNKKQVFRTISLLEFDTLFERLKNWGRWGAGDELGTLNYITPDKVAAAAALVKSGRSASMAIPIDKTAGPDNPNPAIHYMATTHDVDVGSKGVGFATDFLGMQFHGDCYTHLDALCHISYKGLMYNGIPASKVDVTGAGCLDVTAYAQGIVGRGVLIDVPRYRGVKWLEPGEAVTAEEIEAIEKAQGVWLGSGDIMLFRTGQYRRRLELGAWDVGDDGSGDEVGGVGASVGGIGSGSGEGGGGGDGGGVMNACGRAGLDPYSLLLLHEREVAAFLPEGDGEVAPSYVEAIQSPIHPLQVAAMGMFVSDSLQMEEVARICEEENRFECMVVAAPLRLPGGTGCPFNPIAIF